MSIGKKIREIREKNLNTQKQMAAKLNISTTTLSAYENDTKTPVLNTLILLAKEYHVSLDWLCDTNIQNNSNTIETYGDIIERLIDIDRIIPLTIKNYEDNPPAIENTYMSGLLTDYVVYFNDAFMNKFFQEWREIKKVKLSSDIQKKLYDVWAKDTINNAKQVKIRTDKLVFTVKKG